MKIYRKTKLASMALMLLLVFSVSLPVHASAVEHSGKASKVDRTIRISTLDISMDKTRLDAQVGETVRFIVTNKGQLTHEFIIGNAQEQAEHEKEMQQMAGMDMPNEPNGIMLKPGQTKTLIWTFNKKGEVEFACHVPGHFAAGMVGKIIVNPNAR